MFLVDAEDDGLGEAVGLLEEVGQVPGDGLGAGRRATTRSKSLVLVLLVGDLAAVAVELALGWAASRRRPTW